MRGAAVNMAMPLKAVAVEEVDGTGGSTAAATVVLMAPERAVVLVAEMEIMAKVVSVAAMGASSTGLQDLCLERQGLELSVCQ